MLADTLLQNHYKILQSLGQGGMDDVTKHLRLSHMASEIARNLMDTAEKAKRGT